MREDVNLKEAIDYCESLGFVVIDKERIKKLSFSMAERDMLNYPRLEKENLDRIHEEDALYRIFEELKQSGLIKKTSRKEKLFCDSQFDGSPEMTITTWALRLVD